MLDGKSEGGKKKEKGTRNKREKTNQYERISVSLDPRDAKEIDQSRVDRNSRFIRLEVRGSNRAVVLSFTKISVSKWSLTYDNIQFIHIRLSFKAE